MVEHPKVNPTQLYDQMPHPVLYGIGGLRNRESASLIYYFDIWRNNSDSLPQRYGSYPEDPRLPDPETQDSTLLYEIHSTFPINHGLTGCSGRLTYADFQTDADTRVRRTFRVGKKRTSLGSSTNDVPKNLGYFNPLRPSLFTKSVLPVRKFGVFLDHPLPPSVKTSYMEVPFVT